MSIFDITPISLPSEEAEASKRLTEIRFEALVRMFDFADRKIKSQKPPPPQWFKIEQRLTLEFVRHASAKEIGEHIKRMYCELEDRIIQYEKENK